MTVKTTIITLGAGLILFLASCNRREQIPDNIMDTATMAAFLTEAHLIESYSYIFVENHYDSLKFQIDATYDSLFAKYNVTPAIYDTSLNYYSDHPQLLNDIYKRVAENLKGKEQQ